MRSACRQSRLCCSDERTVCCFFNNNCANFSLKYIIIHIFNMTSRVYCAVFGCMNSSITNPEITFFRLPGNSESFLIMSDGSNSENRRKFPRQFLFGVSSSAYQVEGAWNTDGKGESIWDRFVHNNPANITGGTKGDVASDSYHQWRRDVEMLRELGVDFYRFSISWTRVMPTGLPNSINNKGFEYYDNLIDELLKYNIQPMITLYHFDLPQYLQDLRGWTNPLSSEWFEDYAKVIFKRYASKVKFWLTVNQPYSICVLGYEKGLIAPGLTLNSTGTYGCIKNILLAHAKAYRAYESLYKNIHEGHVGIGISLDWYEPFDNSTDNMEAVERAREFEIGLSMNPIFSKTGDFPLLIKNIVAKNSQKQGLTMSTLPQLTAEEIKLIKGSADFVGVNHYTTYLVNNSIEQHNSSSYTNDLNVNITQNPEWMQGKCSWQKSFPIGIYKMFMYLNKMYDYPKLIITENGWSTDAGVIDQNRMDYIKEYLDAVLLAMEDGTKVKGYFVWSLMDNIEWISGTRERFGLYEVDFESPSKKRTARLSALLYKNIIKTRELDLQWQPKSLCITDQ